MNKKGYDMKTLIVWVVAIFFFVLLVALILGRLKDNKEAESCYNEDLCYPRSEGCPIGAFDDGVHKCADDKTNVCCLTLEDKIKYGKSSGEVPVLSNNSNGTVSPVNGNINVRLGNSSSQITSAKTLKAGNSYVFKVSVDGTLASCSIKILDMDTLIAIQDSWVQLPSAGSECKSEVNVILTPGLAQVNKAYRMEVTAQNSSNDEVKSLSINLDVIPPDFV